MKMFIKRVLLAALVVTIALTPVQETRAVSCPPGAIIWGGVPAVVMGIHVGYGLKNYDSRCAEIAKELKIDANDYELIHRAHPELAREDLKLGVEAWGAGLLAMLTLASLAGY